MKYKIPKLYAFSQNVKQGGCQTGSNPSTGDKCVSGYNPNEGTLCNMGSTGNPPIVCSEGSSASRCCTGSYGGC